MSCSGKGSGSNPMAALLDSDLDDLWGNRNLPEEGTRKSLKRSAEPTEGEAEEPEGAKLAKEHSGSYRNLTVQDFGHKL